MILIILFHHLHYLCFGYKFLCYQAYLYSKFEGLFNEQNLKFV